MVQTLPFADTKVVVPGFGAMGFSMSYGKADDAESKQTLAKAIDLGCTFWDSAVVYGAGHNEQLIGDFFRENGGREKVFVASKCGIKVDFETKAMIGTDNSAENITTYIDGTIERLGFTPDLYYIHRIEPGRDLKESIGALQSLKEQGKTKYIGLSECSAKTLRAACAIAHIDALQVEYSPFFTEHETNGLLDAARELGVAIIAYSPLGKGILTGSYTSTDQFGEGDIRRTIPRFQSEQLAKNMTLVDEFKKLAEKKGCTSGQLALAWVVAQGAIPIPGTKNKGRLEENFGATEVVLSEEELREIRKLITDVQVVGARYGESAMKAVGH